MKQLIESLRRIALKIFDYGFSMLIITPLLLMFWVSTWNIFDFFLLKSDNNKIISFAVGFCGQFLLLFYESAVRKILNVNNQIMSMFMSRIYILICGIVNVCFWRFIWVSYDGISTTDDNSIILNIIQNSLLLMVLRVFRNSISVPFVILTDEKRNEIPECATFLRALVSCIFFSKIKRIINFHFIRFYIFETRES